MPNDAKLGMVVGVGLVVLIAVVFFRRESAAEPVAGPAAAAVSPGPARGPSPPANQLPGGAASSRKHMVREGDTLYNLARQYYHDDRRFVDIFRANQDVLTTVDPLTPGTILVIPEAPARQ